MELLLVGDICLLSGKRPDFSAFDDEHSQHHRHVLGNLNSPVAEGGVPPRPKAGLYQCGSSDDLERVASQLAPISLVLANHHIMDFGREGLKQTLAACDQLRIHTAGAGESLESAERSMIINKEGRTFGVLSRCDPQFGRACIGQGGVAPLTPNITHEITSLREKCDFVIVSYHAGSGLSPWPSPTRRHLMRSLIDAGANIVYGHQSHVPQAYEKYNDGHIFYGLGNFLVDPAQWSSIPNTLWSIMPEIKLKNRGFEIAIHTVVIEDKNGKIRVRFSNETEHEEHDRYMKAVHVPLEDPDLLEGLWQEHAVRLYQSQFKEMMGFDFWQYEGSKRNEYLKYAFGFWRGKRPDSKIQHQNLLRWYLFFANGNHRDLMATALGVLSGEIANRRNERSNQLAQRYLNV